MLRKVRIDNVGDTDLLPGLLVDKFELKKINDELDSKGRVTDPGGSDYVVGDKVALKEIEEVNQELSRPIRFTSLKKAKEIGRAHV